MSRTWNRDDVVIHDRVAFAHTISLIGDTVYRDGRPVKITLDKSKYRIKIGCTVVEIPVLSRLLELANDQEPAVLQEGIE